MGTFLFLVVVAGIAWVAYQASQSRIGAKNQKIAQTWSCLIQDGASQADRFFDQVRELIMSREIPGLKDRDIEVSDLKDEKLFSETRRFMVIRNSGTAKEFRIYVGVRPYGRELQVSWYLVVQPELASRVISRLLTLGRGDRFAYAETLSVFAHQDLSAHASVVHSCVKEVIQATMEKLGQDFSKVDTRSKGVLELW